MQKLRFFLLGTALLTANIFTSCNQNSVDIMILGVNTTDFNEIDILVNSLEGKTNIKIDNINFYKGHIANKNVVVVETPVRTSHAAMAATIGIKHFQPKVVISEGSSGGHHKDVHINHIILAKDIIDAASYEGDGSDPSTWTLQQPILHSNERLLTIANNVTYDIAPIKSGIVASADSWNIGKEFVNKMHAKFNEDCEEMESYGITSVCNHYNIPSLSIKIISNNLITEEYYTEEASKNLQRYVLNVVKSI